MRNFSSTASTAEPGGMSRVRFNTPPRPPPALKTISIAFKNRLIALQRTWLKSAASETDNKTNPQENIDLTTISHMVLGSGPDTVEDSSPILDEFRNLCDLCDDPKIEGFKPHFWERLDKEEVGNSFAVAVGDFLDMEDVGAEDFLVCMLDHLKKLVAKADMLEAENKSSTSKESIEKVNAAADADSDTEMGG